MTTPDLKPTGEMLDDCLDLALELSARTVDHSTKTAFRTSTADLTRDLLRLSDKLSSASSLVREEYWRLKNEPFRGGS